MDHRGFGLFVGVLFEGLFALFCLPFRLAAWLFRDDDPAAEVDAQAQAFRDAAAAIDQSEREPVAPRETLAQAMRAYLRKERTLGDLHRFGPDASAWALAARYEGLQEADMPRDDAAFDADVRAGRLVSPASMDDMRRALRAVGEPPPAPRKPALPTFAVAEPPAAFAR